MSSVPLSPNQAKVLLSIAYTCLSCLVPCCSYKYVLRLSFVTWREKNGHLIEEVGLCDAVWRMEESS